MLLKTFGAKLIFGQKKLLKMIYVKKNFGEQFNLEDLLFVSLSKISLDCGTKQYVGKPKIFVIFLWDQQFFSAQSYLTKPSS